MSGLPRRPWTGSGAFYRKSRIRHPSSAKRREEPRSRTGSGADGSVNRVAQGLARLEGHGVAGLDLHRLAGLRVLAGAGATMTLDEGAEAHQGNAVLAVQRGRDFVEDGVEHAIRLLFGEVSLLRDGGCEFGFAHKCLFDGLLFLFPVLFNPEQRPRRRNSSALRQTAGEWHAARADASLRPANFHPFAVENAVPARIKAKAPATRGS